MMAALLFAFTAGAVATVNPCGWALLPAWFARRLDDTNGGVPLALGAVWLGPIMPVVGLAVGIVLAVFAIRELAGLRWAVLPGGETCRRVSDRHRPRCQCALGWPRPAMIQPRFPEHPGGLGFGPVVLAEEQHQFGPLRARCSLQASVRPSVSYGTGPKHRNSLDISAPAKIPSHVSG